MQKKYLVAGLCLLLSACFLKDDAQPTEEQAPQPTVNIEDKTFSFSKDTLSEGCTEESQIICAINEALKCTINPDFTSCAKHKAHMPDFIFMVDDSLDRPTEISYQISKLKTQTSSTIEVFTNSTCNGNWFGLCNGNIIYVMAFEKGHWVVKDIYALAD